MPDYITQRRRLWYFELDIPAKLRSHYDGKRRIVQSLQTDSRGIALIKAKLLAAKYRSEFEEIRTGRSPLDIDFLTTVKEWRQDYHRYNDDPEVQSTLDDVLREHESKLAKTNPKHAAVLGGLVRAEIFVTTEHLDEFIAHQLQRVKAKTADMRRSDILEFSATFSTTDKIDRRSVKRWIGSLEAKRMSRATITRKLGALRAYWRFMQDSELLDRTDDPFDKVLGGEKRRAKADGGGSWEPLRDKDVVCLLRAAESKRKPDHQLADLIRLGMWTGCRIEELCALKIDHVSDDHIRIVDAKTPKGIREVPIHRELAPVLHRLIAASTDGYVLSGLDTENKYGSRSSAIGKRFGKLKSAEGFGPKHVFHSIRKTVVTLLENANVLEGIGADIVGHEKKTITYGLYSGGSSLERKAEALSKLAYTGWTKADAHPS